MHLHCGPCDSCLDGAGLICGVLKHLLGRGSSCPKVIATTHFHDLFHNDMLSPYRLPISFVHMQVLFSLDSGVLDPREPTTSGEDDDDDFSDVRLGPGDKIVYLYKCVC